MREAIQGAPSATLIRWLRQAHDEGNVELERAIRAELDVRELVALEISEGAKK